MTGEATLDVEAIHQHAVLAAIADQADICAEARNVPLVAPAWMSLAQGDAIANAQVNGRHPGYAPASAAVAPVKANLAIRRAGTRALMPEYSAATSRVSEPIASMALKASGIDCVKRRLRIG